MRRTIAASALVIRRTIGSRKAGKRRRSYASVSSGRMTVVELTATATTMDRRRQRSAKASHTGAIVTYKVALTRRPSGTRRQLSNRIQIRHRTRRALRHASRVPNIRSSKLRQRPRPNSRQDCPKRSSRCHKCNRYQPSPIQTAPRGRRNRRRPPASSLVMGLERRARKRRAKSPYLLRRKSCRDRLPVAAVRLREAHERRPRVVVPQTARTRPHAITLSTKRRKTKNLIY